MTDQPRKYVQFGAGNIGRSFIGQLFARAGYDGVHRRGRWVVEHSNRERHRVEINHATRDHLGGERARRTVATLSRPPMSWPTAPRAGRLWGPALPFLQPTIAQALQLRGSGAPPLDIILCEEPATRPIDRRGLRKCRPLTSSATVGLIETSIGKMVPIMPKMCAGLTRCLCMPSSTTPDLRQRKPQEHHPTGARPGRQGNMVAYVDRRASSTTSAMCAYFSHLEAPELVYTWEAVEHPAVGAATRAGMWEAARALIAQYPDEFNEDNQAAHIDDLLSRFANKALGDTIYRVGRDVPRKLSRDDRVIGPLLLEIRHGMCHEMTALCAAAGMRFLARDETGDTYAPDQEFADGIYVKGAAHVLTTVCGKAVNDLIARHTMRSCRRTGAGAAATGQGSIFG